MTLGVIAVMLSSCKKDKPSQITESPQTNYTAEDIRIQNLILKFQNKIKNNSFKNGETVSVDSAVWFLEAMMNFNYSTPDSSFVNLTVDTTFEFDLPVNNDLVDFSNLTEAAFAMESHILTYLNNMPNSIKFIIAADVSIKPNTLKDGTKTITITTGYGSEYIINPGCYTPFGANDFWAHGFDWGGCGTNSATTSDAAKQIQYKINNPNCRPIDITISSYIVNVGIEDIVAWDYPNPNDTGYPDNWLDCLMYHESDYDNLLVIDGCLEPEEMNFYLQGTLDVVDMIISEKQNLYPNEEIVFVYLELNGEIASGYDITTYFHEGQVTYGKKVIRIDPIE